MEGAAGGSHEGLAWEGYEYKGTAGDLHGVCMEIFVFSIGVGCLNSNETEPKCIYKRGICLKHFPLRAHVWQVL